MGDFPRRLVPEADIDLLKIDIQGVEQDLLAGPAAWLDRVDCVGAERHLLSTA